MEMVRWKSKVLQMESSLPWNFGPRLLFTKIMMPIKTYLHAHGVQALIYIDDCLTLGHSEEDCKAKMEIARDAWRKAGWIENRSKAMNPTQVGIFLGITITKGAKVLLPFRESRSRYQDDRLRNRPEVHPHQGDCKIIWHHSIRAFGFWADHSLVVP